MNTMLHQGYCIPSDLNRNGFEVTSGESLEKSPFDLDHINRIREAIRAFFTKTPRVQKRHYAFSYSLKHLVEGYLGTYISNGDLIYAMILEGYRFERKRINCYFNLDEKGVKAMETASESGSLPVKLE